MHDFGNASLPVNIGVDKGTAIEIEKTRGVISEFSIDQDMDFGGVNPPLEQIVY